MLNFSLENHKPLREIVYEELKRQILVGEILPGTRMMEIELAEDMGVSRTPVREAIRKLEKEGLVTIEPRKGAYASDVSIKDMLDVLETRELLEGAAAGMAARRIDDEGKEALKRVTEQYSKAVESNDTQEIIRCDEEFHKLIMKASANGALAQLISQVQELSLRFRYIYYDDFSRYKNMPMEHREIEEAILGGDERRATKAGAEHVAKLKEFVLDEGDNLLKGKAHE